MEDEREDVMDLDLNLDPPLTTDFRPEESVSPSIDSRSFDALLLDRIRRFEAVTLRARQRWRWRQARIPSEMRNISREFIGSPSGAGAGVSIGEGGSQTGETSVAVVEERRMVEISKTCKKNAGDLIAKALGKGEIREKGSGDGDGDGSSFFECNICLDTAKDPVISCCGHLFCWPCLYRWLHVHSDSKECPVCKGEVTDANITPIYGRGSTIGDPEKEVVAGEDMKIPPRPRARRIESLRQSVHRAASSLRIEEMIRRIDSRFNVTGEWALTPDSDSVRNALDEINLLEIRRGLNREGSGQQETVDSIQSNATSSAAERNRSLPSLRLLRAQSQRAASLSYLSSALNSAERLVQAYFLGHPLRRNQTQSPPPVEDRDSVSSIAAVIHSGSQTMDTAMEIDSTVSLSSSSSSRRRTDASRISDVDSGVSRATRRRRLQ